MELEKAIDIISSVIGYSELEYSNMISNGTFLTEHSFEKAIDKSKLVEKKVWVSKKGKTYQTTVWVKEGEDAKVEGKAKDVSVGMDIAVDVLGMNIKRYSDNAVLVTGNTYDNVDALREVKKQTGAGNWNRKLNGWVFPVKYLSNLLGQLVSDSEKEQSTQGDHSVDAAVANVNRVEVKNATPINTEVQTPIGKGKIVGVSHDGDKVQYKVQMVNGKVVSGLSESDFKRLETTSDSKVREALNNANETNRASTTKAITGEAPDIFQMELDLNKGKEDAVIDLQKKRQSFINRLKGLATPKKPNEPSKKKNSAGYSGRASMTKAELNAKLEEMGMMSVEDFYKQAYGEFPTSGAVSKANEEATDPEARSKAMMGNKNAEGKRGGKSDEEKVLEAKKKIDDEKRKQDAKKEAEETKAKTKEAETARRGSRADVKKRSAKNNIKKETGKTTSTGTDKRYSIFDLMRMADATIVEETYKKKTGWSSVQMRRMVVTSSSGEVLTKGSKLTVIGELVRIGKLTNEDVEAFVMQEKERFEAQLEEFNSKWPAVKKRLRNEREALSREDREIVAFSSRVKDLAKRPELLAMAREMELLRMEESIIDSAKREYDKIEGAHLANIQFDVKTDTVKNLKTGKDVSAKNMTSLAVDQMKLYSVKNILDTPRPNWIPEISDSQLRSRQYSHDAILMPDGNYLVAMNGFKRSSDGYSNYGNTGEGEYDADYHIMSREHFAAMTDYHITRAKAIAKRDADEKNKASAERYENQSDEFKARYPGGYKKHGAKRVKVLKADSFLTSQTHMLREFIDQDMSQSGIYENITAMKDDLGIAWNDFTVSREDYSGAYLKGKETSYGDINATDQLLKSHGVLIKKQNGKEMDSGTEMWLKDKMDEVYKSFGNRSETARDWGLKISHSGDKLQHASKALGLFTPTYNAIGVSEHFGSNKGGFTLAHEFAHFMDWNLAKKTNSGRFFASHDTNSTAGKIASTFRNNLNDKSLGSHKYFGNSHECFARALEQYSAMKNYGDDVTKVGGTYSESDSQVNSDTFNKEIKPLIEQFLSETKDILKSMMSELTVFKAIVSSRMWH